MNDVVRRSIGGIMLGLVVVAICVSLTFSDDDATSTLGFLGAIGGGVVVLTLFIAIGLSLIRGPELQLGGPKLLRPTAWVTLTLGLILVVDALVVAAIVDASNDSGIWDVAGAGVIVALYVGLPLMLWSLVHARPKVSAA